LSTIFKYGFLGLAAVLLNACVYDPPYSRVDRPAPVQKTPPPSTKIFFYPNRGQTPKQQERDRYECYLWAVEQTGFDPSKPRLAPHQRYDVIPESPEGSDTAAGAMTGAILGAIVSPPGKSAQGAMVGAVAGAMLGSESDAAQREQKQQLEQYYNDRSYRQADQKARHYRRAMAACLSGRGYTVR